MSKLPKPKRTWWKGTPADVKRKLREVDIFMRKVTYKEMTNKEKIDAIETYIKKRQYPQTYLEEDILWLITKLRESISILEAIERGPFPISKIREILDRETKWKI